jgi:O-Antigen ligase
MRHIPAWLADMNGAELQWQFMRAVWLGGFLLVAGFCGLLLGVAGHASILLYVFAPIIWLLLLPYHGRLAVLVSTIAFGSAFIVPFVPGRPLVWEATSMLGWSGVVVSLALREQTPGAADRWRRNWVMVAGTFAYCAVLVFLIRKHGVGISTFGGSVVGGRIYFQQIIVSVFPLLFIILCPDRETLITLYKWQCWLSLSFLVADFALSSGGEAANFLLYFFELPTDGLSFEITAISAGLRRYQSLFYASFGFICYLWMRYPLRAYFSTKGLWLFPLTSGILLLGLLSGHRMLFYLVFSMLFILGWAQRLFSPMRIVLGSFGLAFLYFILFLTAKDLPLGIQRPLSAIPGIQIDRLPFEDARATIEGRNAIRSRGWEAAPKYRWVGRGFGKEHLNASQYYDLTDLYVENGMFFNGTVGLLVNTGLPGTVGAAIFFIGGVIVCWRIISRVRRQTETDTFDRMGLVVAAVWIAYLFSFIFLHGDSEFTMRQFALPAGFLVACEFHMLQRERDGKPEEAKPEPAPKPIPRLPGVRPYLA